MVTLNSRHKVRDAGKIEMKATFTVPLAYLQTNEVHTGNIEALDSGVGGTESGAISVADHDIFPVKSGTLHA